MQTEHLLHISCPPARAQYSTLLEVPDQLEVHCRAIQCLHRELSARFRACVNFVGLGSNPTKAIQLLTPLEKQSGAQQTGGSLSLSLLKLFHNGVWNSPWWSWISSLFLFQHLEELPLVLLAYTCSVTLVTLLTQPGQWLWRMGNKNQHFKIIDSKPFLISSCGWMFCRAQKNMWKPPIRKSLQ